MLKYINDDARASVQNFKFPAFKRPSQADKADVKKKRKSKSWLWVALWTLKNFKVATARRLRRFKFQTLILIPDDWMIALG